MSTTRRLRLSRAHRTLGMIATVPIVGWILSSFVLHGVALTLPNGLQGVYELQHSRSTAVPLEDTVLITPTEALHRVLADGLDRI